MVEFMKLCGLSWIGGKMETTVWKPLEKLWLDGTQLLKGEKPTGSKPSSGFKHSLESMIA